jgi:diguanylate cyclase (GGDEF)-like protein
MEPARILVVEDEALVGEELRQRLTHLGLAVDGPVRSGTEAIRLVKASTPDLVLMDIRLAGAMDGIHAAGSIRSMCDVPIVFLTAFSDDVTIERARQTDPFGYLPKPVSEQQLKTTIVMALHQSHRQRDAKERWASRERTLVDDATRDPLTGVWNRKRILQILDTELVRASRERRAVTVFMIDLDHLKEINDTYGHLVGDAVLREVSSRMTRVVRRYDSLGRYGGDEFLLVSTNPNRLHATETAARLKDAVAAAPIRCGSEALFASISVGTWTGDTPDYADTTSFVESADRALYDSKKRREPRVSPTDAPLVRRIQSEFREMPGLCLTVAQAQRLWGLTSTECEAVFDRLHRANFLTRNRNGAYMRSDS